MITHPNLTKSDTKQIFIKCALKQITTNIVKIHLFKKKHNIYEREVILVHLIFIENSFQNSMADEQSFELDLGQMDLDHLNHLKYL